MSVPQPALIEFACAKAPMLSPDAIHKSVRGAIEFTDQFDQIADLLLRHFAREFANNNRPGEPGVESWTYKQLREKYDNNIRAFRYGWDVRTMNEMLDGLPTLLRPEVTLNNLGDGLLPPKRQVQ